MIKVESLEIHVSNHCNLSCRGCSHISPLENYSFIDIDNICLNLTKLSKVLHCGTIRLLGGEPTLNPLLSEIAKRISKIFIADKISISTNGLQLAKFTDELLKHVDVIEISNYNYSNQYTKKIIEWAKEKKKDYNIDIIMYMYKYFREPFSYKKNNNKKLVNNIYKTCILAHKWQCFNIYENYFFKCPEAMALCKNISELSFKDNGILIDDNPDLEKKLLDYINADLPLKACHYCLGTVGKRFEISQVNSKEIYKDYANKEVVNLLDKEFLDQCIKQDVGDMYTVERVVNL